MQWIPGSEDKQQHARMSEDCLNLDLYTPAILSLRGGETEVDYSMKLPIVVWIPGGGNYAGSSGAYRPVQNLVSLSGGKVLVVSVNHRVNVLGFGALPELSEEDPRGVSGNYGLLDIQLALRWVHQNGKAFGGDIARVTLLGHGAGGSDILAMYAMPSNVEPLQLFHAAISLSGAPGLYMNKTSKYDQDRTEWLDYTPCANFSRRRLWACLQSSSFEDLTKDLPVAWTQIHNVFPTAPSYSGFHPQAMRRSWVYVDGVTVQADLLESFRTGNVSGRVPLLMQSMNAEGSLDNFCKEANVPCSLAGIDPLQYSAAQLHTFWNEFLDPGFGEGTGDEVFTHYYSHRNPQTEWDSNVSSDLDPAVAYYEAHSDTAMACAHLSLAEMAIASKEHGHTTATIYVSIVAGRPSNSVRGNPLAGHAWDIAASIELHDVGIASGYSPTLEDVRFGQMLRRLWLQLVENQRLDCKTSWAAYEEVNRTIGIIHKKYVEAAMRGKQDTCRMWKALHGGQQWWWL